MMTGAVGSDDVPPRQHRCAKVGLQRFTKGHTCDENKTIKNGEVPEDWAGKPSQKDVDARWTKKHGKSHFGYKNHVNVDRKHKLGSVPAECRMTP